MSAKATGVVLSPEERRAARNAGGLGLSLFGAGVNVVLVGAVVALLLLVLRAIVLDTFGTMPGDAGLAVREWVDGLDLTGLGWLAAIALVAAGGLGWAGVAASTRILRRAGVEPSRSITVRGCMLGSLLQLGLGLVTSWLLGLLWLLVGLLAPWLIVLLSTVLSIGASFAIGYLAGPVLWRAQVARARRLGLHRVEQAPQG